MNKKVIFLQAAMTWTLLLSPTCAQITSDGTTRTIVKQSNTRFQIERGTTQGRTLFHSFKQFNIPKHNQAYFTNPSGVDLILSRITGKGISNINGTLGVEGGADLFLINPNGIIFGPNASLDLTGSFLATTGSSFVFENGKTFSAISPSPVSNFKVSVPLGIQFGTSSAAIKVQSQLSVAAGQTISFLGGDLNFISSNVSAPRGNIAIGGVDNGSYVRLFSVPHGWLLSYQDVQRYKNISIKDSRILLSPIIIKNLSRNIYLNGEDVSIDNSLIFVNEKIDVHTSKNLNVYNGSTLFGFRDLFIDTRKLKISSGGSLVGIGLLNINASESIEISGYKLFSSQGQRRINRSGIYHWSWYDDSLLKGITINTDKMFLDDGGIIQTSTYEFVGGDININANELSLSDGGKILSLDYSRSVGRSVSSQGGNINLNVSSKISISRKDINSRISDFFVDKFGINSSGIFSASNKESLGRTGNISIRTKEISILDSAQVSIDNQGMGPGGNLKIKAQDLNLENQAIISAKTNNNKLGNFEIDIDNLLLMRNQSKIIYGTEGVGIGGKVSISAPMIIAFPNEDSDILIQAPRAEASVTGKEILGLKERSKPTKMSDIVIDTEDNREPIGEYGQTTKLKVSEFSGIVVQPKKIVKGCRPGQALGNGYFAYKGKGGLPPNPYQNQTMPAIWQDLRLRDLESNSINKRQKLSHQLSKAIKDKEKHQPQKESVTKAQEIVEAKGWVKDKKGQIILTSSLPKYIATVNYQPNATC